MFARQLALDGSLVAAYGGSARTAQATRSVFATRRGGTGDLVGNGTPNTTGSLPAAAAAAAVNGAAG